MFDGYSLSGADSMSDLTGLGEVPVRTPTVDINGDGVLETSVRAGEAALIVMTDHTGDGVADALTIVDDDGSVAAWDYCCGIDGVLRWSLTGAG